MDYDGGVYIRMKRLVLIPAALAIMALAAFPVVFASHSEPLNGSFSGTFTLTSQTKATITGSGHLQHFGETSFAALSSVTGSASCQGGFTADEQETYTAANGDKVFTSSNDVLCPTYTNTFQITGSWTITGGTGRFEDASGTGTFHASGVMTSSTSGTFSLTTTGTITY